MTAGARPPGGRPGKGGTGPPLRPRPKRLQGEARIRNIRLTVEYDGSRYRGWQIQVKQRTVAGLLTRAVGDVVRDRVTLVGAGRTDAGVHAEGQVANFRCRTPMPANHLLDAFNRLLPPDINILRVEDVPMDFHARHSARIRRYRYQIALRRSAFLKPYSWWTHDPPDQQMMRLAAGYLVGRHDFTPFSDAKRRAEEPIVEVYQASFEERPPLLNFRISADHFLPRMVRRIVGALVRVGHHGFPPERLRDFLAGAAPVPPDCTAPAAGLFLEKVEYP